MAKKYCYLFTEGNANMRELLGGKRIVRQLYGHYADNSAVY